MEKTSTGLAENVAGLLCYLGGWITGLIFFLIEKENKLVRFHAMQSIVVFGAITVASFILSWIPIVGAIVAWLLSILALVLWIVLMVKAYQGAKLKLPWAGNLSEKWSGQAV
ncbi:DUF4870 domain-containing protein [Chloroflexota bacterium]